MSALRLRAIAIRPTKEYGTPEIWTLHIRVNAGSPSEKEGGKTAAYT